LTKSKSLFAQLISNWPAKALSLAAAILLFIFHNFSTLSERFISVELTAAFADGLTAAQPYPRRVRVEVRGNDRSLSAVTEEDISAIADFSRFDTEGVYTTPVTIQKKGVLDGLDTIEIGVDPLEITLPVQKKVRKRVEVTPVFKGLPAAGFRLDQYTVNPTGIDLEGPQGIVQTINSISTEDIDLSNKRDSFTLRASLVNVHPLLTFPGGNTVDFRGQIMEALELRTFENIPVTLQGFSSRLTLEEEAPIGWLTIQGGPSALEAAKMEKLQLVIDCAGLTENGVYNLPVKPLIPSGLNVLQFGPDSVTLVIQRGGKVSFQ
jgi:YbbR domain-containing protein